MRLTETELTFCYSPETQDIRIFDIMVNLSITHNFLLAKKSFTLAWHSNEECVNSISRHFLAKPSVTFIKYQMLKDPFFCTFFVLLLSLIELLSRASELKKIRKNIKHVSRSIAM